MILLLLVCQLLLNISFYAAESDHSCKMPAHRFDIQGHRGARGLLPENTIPAFLKAAELGVQTLELDVVVSSDHQVIVSHEPFLNPQICLDPDGNPITDEHRFNLYRMKSAEIQQCDCGSLVHPKFPKQKKMVVPKPLLSEVFAAIKKTYPNIGYNIEIKSTLTGDGVSHPTPETFAQLLLKEIEKAGLLQQVTVQSFDPRSLQAMHRIAPNLCLAYLTDNNDIPAQQIRDLGFVPAIYSPHHKLLDPALVYTCHQMGMKVIPWTVNEVADMDSVFISGADGLITDYPDIAINWYQNKIKH